MLKNPPAMQETQRGGFDLRVKKIPWRRKWQPTSVILPRKIPWTEEPSRLQSMGYKELDMTEQLNNHNYCLDIFYNYNHIHMYTHTHTHTYTHTYIFLVQDQCWLHFFILFLFSPLPGIISSYCLVLHDLDIF